tara:strand:- start:701 stop:1636 length:936 start_codon:yes stop_codon:yes gene_type:complete
MNYPVFFDCMNSINLFGLEKKFKFLSNLYYQNKFPKVLLLTGNKGSGKSTLINHFLYSIFDKQNYDKKKLTLLDSSSLNKKFKENSFPNVIHINGCASKAVSIDDIRELKTKIFKTTILNFERFIILDDIELFNTNSLNGLLRIIEEPSKNNYFILIYNKSKPLLETIKSRSLELKIILSETNRINIIKDLVNKHKLDIILDPNASQLSPGNFLKFNYIFKELDISINNNLIGNLSLLLNLYKKSKDIIYFNLAFFITDFYFKNLRENNNLNNDKIYEIKQYFYDNLNNFLLYNINQNILINKLSNKLNYE